MPDPRRIRRDNIEGSMSKQIFAIFLLSVFSCASPTDSIPNPCLVKNLTESDFETTIKNNPMPIMLRLFAHWCGHCKRLTPVWDNLSLALCSETNEIMVAQIDVDQEKALSNRFQVSGIPKIVLVKGGVYYEYDESRELSSLMNFAKGGYTKKQSKAFGSPFREEKGKIKVIMETISELFTFVKLGWIPLPVQVSIVLAFFMLPVILFVILMCEICGQRRAGKKPRTAAAAESAPQAEKTGEIKKEQKTENIDDTTPKKDK